jgi:hypothetical protein
MSDYFTKTIAVPDNVAGAAVVIASASVDRFVQTDWTYSPSGFKIGFSSSSIVLRSPIANTTANNQILAGFLLPAGEEVWAVSDSGSAQSWTVLVTKPATGSITFTCS